MRAEVDRYSMGVGMKRLLLCLAPFFAIGICALDRTEENHKKFIESIYADAGKSFQFDRKPYMDAEKWQALVKKVAGYAPIGSYGTGARFIETWGNGLSALFESAVAGSETLGTLTAYITDMKQNRDNYQGLAEKSHNIPNRRAEEATAAFCDVMGIAVLRLFEKIEYQAKPAAQRGKFSELWAEWKKKPLYPEKIEKKLDEFKGKQFIETSADKKFEELNKRIDAISSQAEFQSVLTAVNEYAKKQSPAAYDANMDLVTAKTHTDRAEKARVEAKKIAESFFTSRSKRYPYELYAKLWDQRPFFVNRGASKN